MLSRRWKQRKNVKDVGLFIVDELHLVGGTGGATLEVICSRMRYISNALNKNIRIVGLAHSVANAKDLGDWLGVTSHGFFNFPPGSRPTPLEIHVQGFDIVNFEARMQVGTWRHVAGGCDSVWRLVVGSMCCLIAAVVSRLLYATSFACGRGRPCGAVKECVRQALSPCS